MRALLAVVACLVAHPPLGTAQARRLGPLPSVLFAAGPGLRSGSSLAAQRPDTSQREIRPTYWKKGAAIGGGVGALGGLILGYAACGLSQEAGQGCSATMLVGLVGGGGILALVGAIVGGQFTKPDE
jgi:hypothetical protein